VARGEGDACGLGCLPERVKEARAVDGKAGGLRGIADIEHFAAAREALHLGNLGAQGAGGGLGADLGQHL
jgi:hypothetical protein